MKTEKLFSSLCKALVGAVLAVLLLTACSSGAREISLSKIDTAIPQDAVSSTALDTCAREKLDALGVFAKGDYVLGKIMMELDAENRGTVRLYYAQTGKSKPHVYYVVVNSESGVLERVRDMGNDEKNNPGVIHPEDWAVDSVESVKLAKAYFEAEFPDEFRYDSVDFQTVNTHGKVENEADANEVCWVFFNDEKNGLVYRGMIEPYEGVCNYGSRTEAKQEK